jgi:propionate CoA-transferase
VTAVRRRRAGAARGGAGALSRLASEAAAAARLARWGLAMLRRDTRRPSPVPESAKFASAREAVERIPDGAVVAVSGLGVQQRASVLFVALRERFEETGRPRRLTLVNIGGHGGRGILPGTLDELALPGLCARLVTSHFETLPAFLALAAAGRCELQCLPLGVIAQLYDAQRRGEGSVLSEVGLGTFIDPRSGRGSPVQGGRREQLVRVAGGRLRYRLPPIDVALFNLPAADRLGNLYVKGAATVGDSYEIACAARRSGGLVIANVGRVGPQGGAPVFLPARKVDAIVFDPDAEQTPGYFHRAPWSAVTTRSRVPIRAALEQARVASWLGRLGGGLARRSAADELLFRLAAFTLASEVRRGARIAIGAGLPEEIARLLFESGRLGDVTFLVESGAVGGLPGSGAYFGAAFSPRELVSPAKLFERCRRRLDAACLGALEVDGEGCVNVSRRGRGVRHYAGPGGFMDFTAAARTLVFVSGWMRGGALAVEGDALRVSRRGRPKFVEKVGEVTFDGRRALAAGKRIFYVTPVGVFRLTARGMQLAAVVPGVDVHRDILSVTPIEVVLPASGEVPLVPTSVVSGAGFRLPAWGRSPFAPAPRGRAARHR